MSDPSDNTPLPDRWAQRAILSAFYGDFSEDCTQSRNRHSSRSTEVKMPALILSPTGSGKTEAALAPSDGEMPGSGRYAPTEGPVIVYTSPQPRLW